MDNKRNGVEQFLDVLAVDVSLSEFAEKCGLDVLCGDGNALIKLKTSNVNRPGLLLAGFEDYFVAERVQVLGNAESHLLSHLDEPDVMRVTNRLLSKKPPCVIFTHGIMPDERFLACAVGYNVPVLATEKLTTVSMRNITDYLNDLLAELVSLHGTLIEVSGVGVLITGESAMGKSETALELVHRGHKLIADDVVIAKKIGDKIIGSSPETIRFFMEVRGIGIIDVRELFGVGSVLYESPIDLIIKLESWTPETESERIMYRAKFENILGLQIPKHIIPVMAGRNLAIVVEVAARNHHLRSMGIDSTKDLFTRQKFT